MSDQVSGTGGADARPFWKKIFGPKWQKGEMVSTVKGPDWFRKTVLKGAGATGRVDPDAHKQVEHMGWRELSAPYQRTADAAADGAVDGQRTLRQAAQDVPAYTGPELRAMFGMPAEGPLNPVLADIVIDQAPRLGLDPRDALHAIVTGGTTGGTAGAAQEFVEDAGQAAAATDAPGAAAGLSVADQDAVKVMQVIADMPTEAQQRTALDAIASHANLGDVSQLSTQDLAVRVMSLDGEVRNAALVTWLNAHVEGLPIADNVAGEVQAAGKAVSESAAAVESAYSAAASQADDVARVVTQADHLAPVAKKLLPMQEMVLGALRMSRL